eukprot:Protomagalhaensia_sp_Gyna_25__2056@NODE_2102_length_1292_cov_7_035914_g1738_i0_p1_GENE_NODE_2102_length_1292_cov_7_035914_g1738_i0NODE_2102_length_1292_cov_7_035914_g1738_i0_p1_ORF_typecomplete_len297_score22_84KAR9/PF08580_10/6_4_NODE_2102_length_1292_cov_7_035914_g1738_i072893
MPKKPFVPPLGLDGSMTPSASRSPPPPLSSMRSKSGIPPGVSGIPGPPKSTRSGIPSGFPMSGRSGVPSGVPHSPRSGIPPGPPGFKSVVPSGQPVMKSGMPPPSPGRSRSMVPTGPPPKAPPFSPRGSPRSPSASPRSPRSPGSPVSVRAQKDGKDKHAKSEPVAAKGAGPDKGGDTNRTQGGTTDRPTARGGETIRGGETTRAKKKKVKKNKAVTMRRDSSGQVHVGPAIWGGESETVEITPDKAAMFFQTPQTLADRGDALNNYVSFNDQ